MDDQAAARFGKKVEAQDTDTPPTVAEVLNTALKQNTENSSFSEVIVLLSDPNSDLMICLCNLSKIRDVKGMLAIAMQGPG